MSGAAASAVLARWLPCWRPKPEARVRLFCLPFAGGTASLLHRWAQLGPEVDGLAVQYPGRERRFAEPPIRRVPELVEALGPIVLSLLDRPYALFGYSLGTYVSLELARWLERQGAPAPLGLLLAAGVPPHQHRPSSLHALPTEELLAECRRYGGTPPEVLAHRELMELLLPMLRADFEMAGLYEASPHPPLSLRMAVWGGQEDPFLSAAALERWRDYTTGAFTAELLPGGHFFMNTPGSQLLRAVERTALQWARSEV